MGNKSEVLRERQGLSDESGVYSYTYDELNRLLDVSKDNTVLRAYEYDGYGNRTKMTADGAETSYIYNSMNQLISTVDSLGDEQVYSYDKRGNLTAIHKNDALVQEFSFGVSNRLEQAKNHETKQSANYSYNGMGYRVGQTVGGLDLNPTKQIDDVLDLTRQFNNLLHRSEDGIATDYIWDANLLSATTSAVLRGCC
jgi:YD repeat-containing protein